MLEFHKPQHNARIHPVPRRFLTLNRQHMVCSKNQTVKGKIQNEQYDKNLDIKFRLESQIIYSC